MQFYFDNPHIVGADVFWKNASYPSAVALARLLAWHQHAAGVEPAGARRQQVRHHRCWASGHAALTAIPS